MDLGLAGRRAIITGASQGIGAATARALATEGARVALIARNDATLRDVAASIGDDAVAVVGDLATASGVHDSIGACLTQLGGVDILVNNAGSSPGGSIDDITDDQWQAAFDLKVMGYLRCMKAVLPAMRAQRFGRIVNVGGVAGIRATPGYTLAALNAALVHLTRTTAEHVGHDGISVVSLHPGPTLTERLRGMLSRGAAAAGVDVDEFAATRVAPELPLGRLGTSDEVARMIVVLCSDVASWVTGGGVTIDGGAAKGVVGG
ncbi:MAG TPA: SDR family oxidoreductase [Acidimicrobiales bacterium]|jgi:NAD(P)-dependent dehydrogenase (short-subunit alcohol dehydrogenase family)|nr:SDR family oxidoreductase [Acidimicrobiales bacterium]